MQLQIQKNLVPQRLDAAHNVRAFGVKQLHADFYIGFFLAESVQKGVNRLRVRKVQRDDDVAFAHFHAPPMMSLRDSMP